MYWLFTLALTAAWQTPQPIHYEIAFPNRVHHEAEVAITFTGLPARPLELRMSRSSPGRYALHEFGKNVYAVRALDGAGRSLPLTRPNPHQWNVAGHDGTVRIAYTLYADRADGTYAGIDETHAHLNMPATFMWARGLDDRAISVRFELPEGAKWRIATQLAPTDEPSTFRAPDLQYFMDSPTELSAFTLREWIVESGSRTDTIRLAIHHAGSEREVDEYVAMARDVVGAAAVVFGEMPRFDYGTYTFIADYLPNVRGDGMEHRNSTILTSQGSLSRNAGQLIGTVSHEFFHAWNIERLRPAALEPFDFERANMSDALWFGEGFTSYYGSLLLRRSGIRSLEDYVAGLSNGLDAVINGPGRAFFSAAEMSLRAPFVDQSSFNDPTNDANLFISYYTWGSVIALGLDLALRERFAPLTLDDYMRAMWREHGRAERPYTMADLQRVLGHVTEDPRFAAEFFGRYVTGREVLDYQQLLAPAGLLLRHAEPGRAVLGDVELRYEPGGARIATATIIGTPLYESGLDRGDRIASIDGTRLQDRRDLETLLAARQPGDTVTIRFQRYGAARTATAVLQASERLEVVTFEDAGLPVTNDMERFREAWLGGKAPH